MKKKPIHIHMIFSGTSMERHLAVGTEGVLALTGATGGMIRNDMSAMAYVDSQVHNYAGATTLWSSGSGGLTFTELVFMGNGDPGANLTWDGANNGYLNHVQIVSGKSLIKNGGGTWTISGQGLFDGNGNTTINAGTLKIGGAGTLGSGSYAQTISIGTDSTFHYSSSANQVLGGNMAGSGQIIKDTSAASVLTLSGTNNYSGTTTVSAGILRVNGTHTGGGDYTVGDNGTLQGTGSTTSLLNVSGVLSPGASVQSFGSGTLSLLDTSTFEYEVDSSVATAAGADLQVVNGALNLTGTVTLTLADIALSPTAFALGTQFSLINYSGPWNEGLFTFDGDTITNGGDFTAGLNTWRLDYDATSGGLNFDSDYTAANFVNITVIPEPTSAALFGLGGLVLLRRRR